VQHGTMRDTVGNVNRTAPINSLLEFYYEPLYLSFSISLKFCLTLLSGNPPNPRLGKTAEDDVAGRTFVTRKTVRSSFYRCSGYEGVCEIETRVQSTVTSRYRRRLPGV
jgi:hypothetical protein